MKPVLKVICDHDDKPHAPNPLGKPCVNPTRRYAQWQPCVNGGHMAQWTPTKDVNDPRWYFLCEDCNIEGFYRPKWLEEVKM